MVTNIVPPYPPARYTAELPERSATLRRADQPADYDAYGLVTYHYLADMAKTGGDYGLYRLDLAARSGGPGPHFHRAISEAFFVLSGDVQLFDGEWVDARCGDFLHVPPGGVHAFRNTSDEPASLLMLFTPGAPREAYFEGFAQLADMTETERYEWFEGHDNFFVR